MNARYMLIGLLIVMVLCGIVGGDFVETWRNGGTL